MLSDRCLSCLSVYPVLSVTLVYWPNGWMDQGETWRAGRPQPWPHSVRLRTSSPSPKGAKPQFLAHVCCGQMAAGIKMPLDMEVGLGPGNFVLDREPHCPLPKKGRSPQFSAHFHCGQMTGWNKMALGMEVGLGPCHIVLDPWGPSSPLQKRGTAPKFRPIFIVSKRLDSSRCHLLWR